MKEEPGQFNFAILTVSDTGSRGEREDTSGAYLRERLEKEGFHLAASLIIPDNEERIVEVLTEWADSSMVNLIVTTGGTGVAPTDVTPDATGRILEKEIPGMAEAMRAASLQKTPRAVLSRAKVGIRGKSLIVNLPGSERGARENIEVLIPSLTHALYKICGGTDSCGG